MIGIDLDILNKSMFKINSSNSIYKKCVSCDNQVLIKVYSHPNHPEYKQPISAYKKRIACSRECHKNWQLSITWEDRVGQEFANEFRKKMSMLSSDNNPSTFPGVAEKISNSLKDYLSKHPEARLGENNGFFGRKHTDKTIMHWKNTKAGKCSYTPEQKEKQTKNTPKKDKHHNWHGGISNGEYGLEFNKELKENLKNLYNHVCQLCNSTDVELDIHHIDYNKNNNNMINLVPLCKKCHGKTNFNREKWKKLLTENKNRSNINAK